MNSIMALADKHDFKVIEDCAQAHGAKYKGKSVGTIGHIGACLFAKTKSCRLVAKVNGNYK